MKGNTRNEVLAEMERIVRFDRNLVGEDVRNGILAGDGDIVLRIEGDGVGRHVGEMLGDREGRMDGMMLGTANGFRVGKIEDGVIVDTEDDKDVGRREGTVEAPSLDSEGAFVGV